MVRIYTCIRTYFSWSNLGQTGSSHKFLVPCARGFQLLYFAITEMSGNVRNVHQQVPVWFGWSFYLTWGFCKQIIIFINQNSSPATSTEEIHMYMYMNVASYGYLPVNTDSFCRSMKTMDQKHLRERISVKYVLKCLQKLMR